MSCCGQNRAKARIEATAPAQSRAAAKAAITKRDSGNGPVARLRYTGVAEIMVRGARTGRSYSFSAKAPEQTVDRTDAEALLRLSLFKRV